MTIYSDGLRRSELINLKIADIDSARMLIKVCGAKGKKNRYTLLSERLLYELRTYLRARMVDPIVQPVLGNAVCKARIRKHITPPSKPAHTPPLGHNKINN
jgi:site-specific recombinase XerD